MTIHRIVIAASCTLLMGAADAGAMTLTSASWQDGGRIAGGGGPGYRAAGSHPGERIPGCPLQPVDRAPGTRPACNRGRHGDEGGDDGVLPPLHEGHAMTKRRFLLMSGSLFGAALGARAFGGSAADAEAGGPFAVTRIDAEWRRLLTPAQYAILRGHGTEPPFSSPLDHETRRGRYDCAGCAHPLYSSETKYDSGTGWPSFWQPLDGGVDTTADNSLLMHRIEVHCHRCGGHLGHLFDDGPKPTGLRYCMDGAALAFVAA